MNFQDFNLSQEVKRAIADAGYTEATAIQEQSIPLILDGKDIIGFSQTGSGKTAAFGLPAIDFVDYELNPKKTQVLVLCPTRELAMQGTDELKKFAKYKEKLHIVPVYGGQQIDRQFQALRRGCQIVIGTPGRIMDHMNRRTIKLEDIRMVILDEADEMLNMGFREDIETILAKTPENRQTVLFSATMPKAILDITKTYQHDAKMVKIERKEMTVSTIEQSFFEVARGRKKDALSLLLQYYEPKLSIVFCNTKKMVDEVVADLEQRGYNAQGLHGDMKQQQRTQVMNRFKNGGFDILVATDVAARGIDVNDIDIVFNFDLPPDNEYYIHRIGRTGRAGKEGKSFTLIQGGRQYSALMDIARYAKCTIMRKELPLVSQIKDKNSNQIIDSIKKYVENNDCSARVENLNTLKELGFSADQIALALLDKYFKENAVKQGTVDVPIETRDYKKRNPDRPRKERTPNKKAERKFANVDMAKVTISIGRRDKVAPKHILGAVAGESGLPGSIMGMIDIQRDYTTIDVPKQYRARVIKAVNNTKIKDRRVTAK